MTAVLRNFVTVRKNKGDILDPATYRSVLEMIQGILNQYDFAGFNESYQSFIKHLTDYNDPHHVTNFSFFNEIVETTYGIYKLMVPVPTTLDDFKATIAPTVGFLELIRRIVINRYLYDKVRNPDGTVPTTVSVVLGDDWNRTVFPLGPVTLTFPAGINNETDFIKLGWGANTTPVAAIFNAVDLSVPVKNQHVIFHTSRASPVFTVSGVDANYPVSIYGASNDFSVRITTAGKPSTKLDLFTFTNGSATFYISMKPDNSVELRLGSQVIVSDVPCGDGQIYVAMTSTGTITLGATNNSKMQNQSFVVDFSQITPFVSGVVGAPVITFFENIFGLRELTVYKDNSYIVPATDILPFIHYMAPSANAPITGTFTAATGHSDTYSPDTGYNLYLTLTGTWTGTVAVHRSVDGGFTWTPVTVHEGIPLTFTKNCDEAVLKVTNPNSKYRLDFTVNSGSIIYRFAQ